MGLLVSFHSGGHTLWGSVWVGLEWLRDVGGGGLEMIEEPG